MRLRSKQLALRDDDGSKGWDPIANPIVSVSDTRCRYADLIGTMLGCKQGQAVMQARAYTCTSVPIGDRLAAQLFANALHTNCRVKFVN